MKKCFKCKRNYPLFLFPKNRSNYQRPSWKGRCFNCRMCTFKTLNKDRYGWLRVNKKIAKVEFKSAWQVLKYVLR